MATRRAFLAGLAAAGMPRLGWADIGSPAYLAAGKPGEAFVLHGLSADGRSLFQIALPGRGHAAAAHPAQSLAVAFARRPGTFALVIDCASGLTRHHLVPPPGNQFNGHGAFTADGAVLLTSEVVAEGSAGRIGLWETEGFTRIGEWKSHGIGPHDIKLLPNGHLIIANGGIQTDPTDRTKLNLSVMRPNLSVLSEGGDLLDQITLPDLPQNSIRHLALTQTGAAFAMQWEGDASDAVPLLGLWTPGQPVQTCPMGAAEVAAMSGYAGSIAVSKVDGTIAITSAKGGAMVIFDRTGSVRKTFRRADLSGVAASADGFIVTDGSGAVWACDGTSLTLKARHETLWDNHLIALV